MHRDAVGPAVTCLTCALRAIATGLKTLQHPVLELDWHHKIQLIQASVVRGLLLFARVADGVAEKSGFVLTGKYRPGKPVPKDSRAASASMGGFVDRFLDDVVLASVERLKPIAQAAGCSMAQMALAWVLREGGDVASAIIGATRPQQVEENAAASDVKLTAETLKAIDEAMAPAISHIGGV